MKEKTFAITLALLICAASLTAAIPPKREPGERWALIAVSDAASYAGLTLGNVLKQGYGYRSANVIELVGPAATSMNVRRAIADLAEKARPSDSVLIHIETPTVGEGPDTSYITFGANANERVAQLTILDVAKSLYSFRASTFLVVLPLCVSPKASVVDTLGPLFGSAPKHLSFMTFCPRNAGDGSPATSLASTLAAVLSGDRKGDLPFGIEEVSELAQRTARMDLRVWSSSGTGAEEFVFLPTRGRLTSYTDILVSPSADVKVKEAAIQDLVRSLQSEPPDRRAELLQNAPQLVDLARNAALPSSLRLRAVWALGEVQHPLAAQTLDAIYTQSSTDAVMRRTVVEAAAKLAPASGTPLLRRALKDSESAVKLVAVRALGQRRDDASRKRIVELMQTDRDPDVRVAALQSIALFPDPDGTLRTAVESLLDDLSPAVRREAVTAWVALGGTPYTDRLLEKLKLDPDPTVRQTIAYSLGRKKPPRESSTVVVRALQVAATPTNPPIVREAAIWSLGELGTAAEGPLLRIVRSRNDDPKIIAAAAAALGKQKSAAAVKPLIELLTDPNVEIRTAAAAALGAIGDASPRVISALFGAMRSGDTYVRAAADRAIDKLSPKRDALLPLLKDPSPAVRAEVALKIGAAMNPADAPTLVPLLSDTDPVVREAAFSSLSKYRDDSARQMIGSTLTTAGADPYRREAAAQLIGTWKWSGGAQTLTGLSKDDDPRVRAQAVRSLGRIADPATSAFVVKAASDRDPQVRLAAAQALPSFSSPEIVTTLKKMSEDPNAEVRQAAIDVLRKQFERP